ncbi:IucA/IucC family siderophore biosynthesis protein [Caballeronia sp. SEWSISQ10-4 2]|uniref:IucA/IucC family protein n=1 Tax=Caballeronia sp. SEWSISQ10-4 2 TaxID=2937438 RepID=UPI00265669A9|nr:IucA/IucC family protein [Caballeronia sp. SEWSISQ10-4 2]MDN7180262.1 IucA/IucC family siderophore biosynthesis protein [Caballeronia sp. SEWSISQ10-4 2]
MKTTLSLLQPENAFYADRQHGAFASARRNALRRIVRCLFAEKIISKDALAYAPEGRGAWLPLWSRHALLFFADLEAAPADTFINRGAITLIESDGTRMVVESPDQMIDLLRPGFDFEPADEDVAGLKSDVANSIGNDALARIYREAWDANLRARIDAAGAPGLVDYLRKHMSVRDAAVLLDQWGALEGHPFYPTWKSKPDLSATEVAELSPEFNATVGVRIASLRADMAYVERMPHVDSYHDWFAAQFPQLWVRWKDGLMARQLDERAWLPLPIHAWHLEHFVRKEYAAEIEEGVLILDGPDVETWPTMSFRTMMPRLPGPVPFIKLPVALWLTSEQRSLQAKSIHMGPRVSTVIKRILADENGFDQTLEIFPEEVAFHYKHAVRQEDRPGRHLSVAYRASKDAFERTDGLFPITVAALLTRSPASGRSLMTELIGCDGAPAGAVAVEAWFRQYARVVTYPVISIYLLYGIALEAHQQNTSVLFAADGTPARVLIRDFGDGRTYAPLLAERGYELKPYVHPGILPTVFDDDIEPVRSFVLDACFVCHLHEVALLLTEEYGLARSRLWEILREETERTFDTLAPRVSSALWQAEREAFLERPWPTRSVLRMHLLRYSDYRLQHHLPNPLLPARNEG